jgi:hypothetical protein
MSNKSSLFSLLQAFPSTVGTNTFPELSIPDTPTTIEEAILCNAKCVRQIAIWLSDAFKNIKVRELYGMVGMLSPAVQAIAGGFLQSDGTDISSATTIAEAIKMLGDESSGGGIIGNIESIARREASGGTLALLAEAITSVPALEAYSDFLSPIISFALDVYAKPGRIGEQVGYIILDNICQLIKEIIINELYPEEQPEGAPPLESESLRLIAEKLRTLDSEGEEAEVPIGSLLQAINQRLSITKGDGGVGEAQFPAGTRSAIIEKEDTLGGSLDKALRYVTSPDPYLDVPVLRMILEILSLYDEEGEMRDETLGDMVYKIAQQLRCTDINGDEVDIPIGSLLSALQKRLAVRKYGEPRGDVGFPAGTQELLNEEPDLIGDSLANIAQLQEQEGIVEIEGTRVWTKAKVVDNDD